MMKTSRRDARFIFLDFDGVLCTQSTYARWSCAHRDEWISDAGWHREQEVFGADQVQHLEERT